MIGEFLSKVAIAVTFAMLAQVRWVGGFTAALLAVTGLLLSLIRDSNLRRRGIIRRLPTLGWVWALSLLVASLLIAFIRTSVGVESLAAPAVVMMAGLVAMV